MKKYLLFSLPVAAMLPLALVVSCSSDNSSNLPELDENGNGISTINPIDVLGDTSNMTIDKIKSLIQPELTTEQKAEVDKIKSSITSTKANKVFVTEVTKDNYQTYFSTKFGEENSILSSALSDGYSIETTLFNYDNSHYDDIITIDYLLKNNNFEYKGSFWIEGFKINNSQPESTTKDKENYLKMLKTQEESLKSRKDLPNWFFGPSGQNYTKANKLLGVNPSYNQEVSRFSYYFTKENTSNNNTYELSLEANVSNNEDLITLMIERKKVELDFWVENGMFAQDGKANRNFIPPRFDNKDGIVDWEGSSVKDKDIQKEFEAKVTKYINWLKDWSKSHKINSIFSAPIKFKDPTEATIKVDTNDSFNLADFKKAKTANERLAMFTITPIKNPNPALENYYSDVKLSDDEKSVTFIVKSKSIVVDDKKTFYKVGDGVDIPQLKLDLPPVNNPDQNTNPENNPNQGTTK